MELGLQLSRLETRLSFAIRRHFFLVRRDWKFYKAVSISQLSKQLLWTKLIASLNGENFFCNGVKMFLA